MTGLVFEWIKTEGGVEVREKHNGEKSQAVYDAIDQSHGFYVYES